LVLTEANVYAQNIFENSIDTYGDGEQDPTARVLPDALCLPEILSAANLPAPMYTGPQSFANKGISETALKRAFAFFKSHPHALRNQHNLAIVDYTLPSYQKRLFVLNLKSGSVAYHYVAHGIGSGPDRVQVTSNQIGSRKSAPGAYITGSVAVGRLGKMLSLEGLESSNNNAIARNTVIVGSNHVSDAFVVKNGFLGLSNGTFAVDKTQANKMIEKLRGGALLYVYWEQ